MTTKKEPTVGERIAALRADVRDVLAQAGSDPAYDSVRPTLRQVSRDLERVGYVQEVDRL